MARIEDHDYLKVCAQLASCLSISIAAAKKKVDLACASQGVRDISSRKEIAKKILKEAKDSSLQEGKSITNQLDNLLDLILNPYNYTSDYSFQNTLYPNHI